MPQSIYGFNTKHWKCLIVFWCSRKNSAKIDTVCQCQIFVKTFLCWHKLCCCHQCSHQYVIGIGIPFENTGCHILQAEMLKTVYNYTVYEWTYFVNRSSSSSSLALCSSFSRLFWSICFINSCWYWMLFNLFSCKYIMKFWYEHLKLTVTAKSLQEKKIYI